MSYSNADADADCSDLLQEFENVFDCWLDVNQFHGTVVDTPPKVRKELNNHVEALRFIKFASAALSAQHYALSHIGNTFEACRSDNLRLPGTQFLTQQDFFSKVPFEIDLHEISKDSKTLSNSYDSEISMKQLTRDLERDRVVLNGRRLVGASEGISGLIAAVGDCVDLTLAHCGLPHISAALRERIAISVLRMACRTNSGGLSFHALRSIVGKSEHAVVDIHCICVMYSILNNFCVIFYWFCRSRRSNACAYFHFGSLSSN